MNNYDGKTEVVKPAASGSNYTYNTWGLDNIGQIKIVNSVDTKYFYLKDHLGKIKMTLNTSSSILGYDDYYPFGSIMPGRSQDDASVDGRYKFTGKERDAAETGWDYFGARYYDSFIGRWLQVDPLANKYPWVSPYNYALNNPLRFIDPNGMESREEEQKREREKAEKEGREKEEVEKAQSANKERSFLSGIFEGAKQGFLSTVRFLNVVGKPEGAKIIMATIADQWINIANNPGDPLHMDKKLDYVLNINKMSSYDLGYDVGFFAEKSIESSLIGGGTIGSIFGKTLTVGKYGFKFDLHTTPHPFGRLGKLSHFQLNIWENGIKGSGKAFRLPLPWKGK